MPEVLSYQQVETVLRAKSLRCLYFNSGSWGFTEQAGAVGWLLGDDPTLTPAARKIARVVGPVDQLVAAVLEACHRVGGEIWILPGSHWAYELDFGTPTMLDVLRRADVVGVDGLVGRNDGSAVRFLATEQSQLAGVLRELFSTGTTSDYQLILPEMPVLAILHHHVQVWWQAKDMEFCQWATGRGKGL
jgi:hypothetical protein